ncbi:threonine-phosphate decarboxylase CobD [Pararhizobium gei]|uniref:threonine-phosphate decarboxylase CobD n=1 Tax=Pararhizobium gei TaxID=1395951 RepID=UPI0023DC68CE|nr:threonine-phosphate decarboxylase CobD [Rhizobium gei]
MPSPIIHGGGITEAASLYGGDPKDWLDLSTGINPNPVALPPIPPEAWHRLPDAYLADAARTAAAHYYGSGGIRPLPVPGTQSVIQLLPRLVVPGRRVAIFTPTYGEYARVFDAGGFVIDPVETIGVEAIGQGLADHGMVVLVNPNNPTGRAFSVQDISGMARGLAQTGGLLLVDEAFGDMQPERSAASLVHDHPNLIVFRSFGKFFGLAGLRLGFVIAAAPVLSPFEEWLGPWPVSGPALSIAASLLTGNRHAVHALIRERKTALDGVLTEAGLLPVGGTALFSLVVHDHADRLHAHLCRAKILTRKFDYAPFWLRVGLAPDAAGDTRLREALRHFDTA